ncbi:MAG: hypothetical protein M3Q77_08925 [Thermoproteota archaeon]|nr:hypothetical protein [Thermoproteota archaeon]
MKKPTIKNVAVFSGLWVIVLLTHEPTWPILSLILLIFLIMILLVKPNLKKAISRLFVGLIPSFAIEIAKMVINRGSGVTNDIAFAHSQGFGIHDLSTIWNNLVTTTQTYLGGNLGIPLFGFL